MEENRTLLEKKFQIDEVVRFPPYKNTCFFPMPERTRARFRQSVFGLSGLETKYDTFTFVNLIYIEIV